MLIVSFGFHYILEFYIPGGTKNGIFRIVDILHAILSLVVAKLSDLKNSLVFWPTLWCLYSFLFLADLLLVWMLTNVCQVATSSSYSFSPILTNLFCTQYLCANLHKTVEQIFEILLLKILANFVKNFNLDLVSGTAAFEGRQACVGFSAPTCSEQRCSRNFFINHFQSLPR